MKMSKTIQSLVLILMYALISTSGMLMFKLGCKQYGKFEVSSQSISI